MTDPGNQALWRKLLVRGIGWCACVGLWTAALLTTYPVEVGEKVVPAGLGFPAAKTLHVCAYAFLTVFLSGLPLGRWRWLLLAFLSLHAGGTEFLQQFVPARTGRLADVFIDHAGMFLGLAFTWKRWAPNRSHEPERAVSSAP